MVDIQRLKQKLFHLDVLIEKQEDCYTAHCLQLDLITDGRTKAEAEAMIVDAISEQITFAIEHNLIDYLFQPAAPEEWRKLLYSNHFSNLHFLIFVHFPTGSGCRRFSGAHAARLPAKASTS